MKQGTRWNSSSKSAYRKFLGITTSSTSYPKEKHSVDRKRTRLLRKIRSRQHPHLAPSHSEELVNDRHQENWGIRLRTQVKAHLIPMPLQPQHLARNYRTTQIRCRIDKATKILKHGHVRLCYLHKNKGKQHK